LIITKTPFRISFFGGGSDYPKFYLKYGGKVIGTTIDKYAYLNIRKLPPFFNYKYRIVYSKIENVKKIENIIHPSVRETLKFLNIDYGVSINYDGDLPARSGIGSSSSFTVGLLNGLNALNHKYSSKDYLTKNSIYIEQNMIKESVGSQDQTFAAYGGFNKIEFLQNRKIVVTPIIIEEKKLISLENNLMLFFSGISRHSSEVAKKQIQNISINVEKLEKMKNLVDESIDILLNKNIDGFGELLDYTWQLKRSLSNNISNDKIDEMYKKAKKAGAIGGKVLGAGGGGFMLFYTKDKQKLLDALKDYTYIPFKFDFNGSKVIYYKGKL